MRAQVGEEGMSVADLAFKLAVATGDVVKTLFMQGIMVQVNQVRAHAGTWPAPAHRPGGLPSCPGAPSCLQLVGPKDKGIT
jgi:hypothetical protein